MDWTWHDSHRRDGSYLRLWCRCTTIPKEFKTTLISFQNKKDTFGQINIKKIMTEREKMLAGELYNWEDADLLNRWHLAKTLQQKYNTTDSRDPEATWDYSRSTLGSRGEDVSIAAPFSWTTVRNILSEQFCRNQYELCVSGLQSHHDRRSHRNWSGVHIYAVFHPVKSSERLPEGWKMVSQTAPVTIGS